MNIRNAAASSAALVLATMLGLVHAAPAVAQDAGTYAFTGVNVVPMDREYVARDQTVIVRDGRIVDVGPRDRTEVPAGATRIDGAGRYLMPGLAEMHAHVPGANAAVAEDVLFLYVAAGVTTTRGMQGHPSQLDMRRRVEAGEIIGPRMWLAAPALSGDISPDSAVRRVWQAKQDGFDLLKVHEGLSRETYAAIVAAAREAGLPWGGHVSSHVGVPSALAAGQSTIDHLDDYIEALQRPDSPALRAEGAERARLLPCHVDEDRFVEIARATRDAGVAVVPTQALWEVLLGARDAADMVDRPENRYVPRTTVEAWTNWTNERRAATDPAAAAREVELRNRLLRVMHDEGVVILMGSDAPQIFSVPGFSLHRELPVMVEAGLTPYEVLRTGTVNVARFLGIEDQAGTVATGRRADLLLLESNPLEDIAAVERVAGVMVAGKWLPANYLQERLGQISSRFGW